jgi:hypothetical protein
VCAPCKRTSWLRGPVAWLWRNTCRTPHMWLRGSKPEIDTGVLAIQGCTHKPQGWRLGLWVVWFEESTVPAQSTVTMNPGLCPGVGPAPDPR